MKYKKKDCPSYCKDCNWLMLFKSNFGGHYYNCFFGNPLENATDVAVISKCTYRDLKIVPCIVRKKEGHVKHSDFSDDVDNFATDLWGGAGPDCVPSLA